MVLTASSQPAVRRLQYVTQWTGLVARMREMISKSRSANLGESYVW
jgi:hypothetical protein